MIELRTPSAVNNLKHDLLLADVYKYLISDEKALWCDIDNRERFLFHCPESWQGKDLVCHWGASRARDRGILKTISGDPSYRTNGVFNLELKTTSNKKHLEARLREAHKSCTYFNEFYIRKDERARYPFSVGVGCLIGPDLTFQCGAITITQNTSKRSKLVGEYYNESDFSKGLRSLLEIVNDSCLFDGLSDYEEYGPLCDSVRALPEYEDDYSVYPMWDSTPPPPQSPPPQQFKEPTLEEIKEAYIKKINQSFLLSKKLKPLAIDLLDLIDESHGSAYLGWVDFAKYLKQPVARVKRWIPQIAEAQVFNVSSERIGKAFKYQISLKKELMND